MSTEPVKFRVTDNPLPGPARDSPPFDRHPDKPRRQPGTAVREWQIVFFCAARSGWETAQNG